MLSHVVSPSTSSPSFSHRSPIQHRCGSVSETTPKLPRKERLASFSRLLNSKAGRPPLKSNNRHINFADYDSKSTPDIKVVTCSPLGEKSTPKGSRYLLVDPNQLPCSPSVFQSRSPLIMSPSYIAPSPTKSPLYPSTIKSSNLGRGSFGNVTLCVYKGSKFALKVVDNSTEVGEKNFLKIRHPHLVSILFVSEVTDKTFIFMEFAGNCNLQQILNTKSELDFHRRLSFCIQTLSGLRHCHQHSLIHGDVKPANVIVSPHGHCKLGDFGHSSRATDGRRSDAVERLVGTAGYAAPEVLRGARPATSADIYSFGVLLWQMQTREMPFQGEHPHVIIYKVVNFHARPKFSDLYDDELMRNYMNITNHCWDSDTEKRPPANELLQDLQKLLQKVKSENK